MSKDEIFINDKVFPPILKRWIAINCKDSRARAALKLGINVRTLERYLAGQQLPPKTKVARLARLMKTDEHGLRLAIETDRPEHGNTKPDAEE